MIKNKEIEVRCLTAEIKAVPTESRTISGYAAKFDSWSEPIMGWFKEVIARDAFSDCDVTDVIMCFNHNPDTILARTTSDTLTLSTDDVGLRFSFTAPNTTLGNDMLELVSRGDINQCSFKFIVEQDEWRYADESNKLEYDERTILKFSTLKDVSLVVYPAYKDTEASVRHLEERKAEYLKPKELQENKNRSIADSQSRERLCEIISSKIKYHQTMQL